MKKEHKKAQIVIKNTLKLPDLNVEEEVKAEESEDSDVPTGPTEAFTQEDLMKHWEAYTREASQKNKMNLVTILKNRTISVDGFRLKLKLDNSLQESALIEYKEELMQFLRKKLNNNAITLETIVEKSTTQRLYTSQDKFDHLVKKYPALNELKSRLGLELDF